MQLRPQGRGKGREGGGGRGEGRGERREGMSVSARTGRVRADTSVLPPGNFIMDATVRPSHGRPNGHHPIIRPFVRYRLRDNPGMDSVKT
jgi:hypothetical protein